MHNTNAQHPPPRDVPSSIYSSQKATRLRPARSKVIPPTQDTDAILGEHARLVESHATVERSLAAEGEENAVRMLRPDHLTGTERTETFIETFMELWSSGDMTSETEIMRD